MRQAMVALVLFASFAAGCTDSGGDGHTDDTFADADAFKDVEVTDSTGAIRGVVVTEAIVPIEGAVVQVTNGANKTTDKDGAFVFNGMEAGDYFLEASAPGFKSIQQAVSVVAGQEPPITKFVLPAIASLAPYTQLYQWDGFLACGVMYSSNTLPPPLGYLGFNACGLTDSRFISDFAVDPTIPAFVQAEATWEGTQPLSNDLSLGFYRGGTTDWKGTFGPAPLILGINSTEINHEFDQRGDEVDDEVAHNVTNLPMRMFPGKQDQPVGLVVTTNQAFTVYQTQFYGFVPREGWTFLEEGPCGSPDQCT